MSQIKKTIFKVKNRMVANLPISIIQRLELSAQVAQGKGWGSATIDNEVKASLTLAKSCGLKEICALDVGANNGLWTLALKAQEPRSEVHAFEPSSVAFQTLTNALHGLNSVNLYQLGIGNYSGKTNLYFDKPGSGLASLSKRRLNHFDIDFSQMEEIELTTLDNWNANRKPGMSQPNLLKMDVEGHELDVLAGAIATLSSIKVIQFEFGGCNIDSKTYLQDFWYFFKERSFKMYRLGPRGLRIIDKYSERDEVFVTTNFFAVKCP